MLITQDNLIKEVSKREGIDVATVRDIFKATEDFIFDQLSSRSPSVGVVIKVLNGLNIERKYIPEKKSHKGLFQDACISEHTKIKANITKHYNTKVNNVLYGKEI